MRVERRVIGRRDEHEIGAGRGEFVDARRVGQRCHHRLALRRTRGDRGALDREVLTRESRCSAVCSGRRSARSPRRGLSRRPPSCPTTGAPPRRRRRPRRTARRHRWRPSRRPNSAASWAVELTRGCQPARPCDTWSRVAMALETWNGSVWVTVATGISPMCCSDRGDACRDQDGVAAAGQPPRRDLARAVRAGASGCRRW